jgi:hypothetical protein
MKVRGKEEGHHWFDPSKQCSHPPLPPSLPPSLPLSAGADFLPASPDAIRSFRRILKGHGRLSTVRESKGAEEMGACGQLGDLSRARGRRDGGRAGDDGAESQA